MQIQSPSQFKKKSIQQKNKQQKLLINTPIINVILTNDMDKMNIHIKVMLLVKQEHQINILSNKQEEPPHKAIK